MALPQYDGDLQSLFKRPCKLCACSCIKQSTSIFRCLECQHYNHAHQSVEEIIPNVLKKLVLLGYSNEAIVPLLTKNGIPIKSVSTLKRRLALYNIRRNEPIDQDVVADLVKIEDKKAKKQAGYRRLHRNIRMNHNIHVARLPVEIANRLLNPNQAQVRLGQGLHKKVFEIDGSNFTWALDGHDKLGPWVLPRRLRMDKGTENPLAAEIQIYLRRNGTDEHAGKKSCIVNNSKLNQKIECYWSGLSKRISTVFREEFPTFVHFRHLQDDEKKRMAFLYVYLPLVETMVKDYTNWWNNHVIRHQRNIALPSGAKPEEMYYTPERFGGQDYGLEYLRDDIVTVREHHRIPDELPDPVPEVYKEKFNAFLERNHLHVTQDTAQLVFEVLGTLD